MSYKQPTLTEIYSELHLAPGSLPQPRFIALLNAVANIGLTKVEFGQVDTFELAADAIGRHAVPRIRAWDDAGKRLLQLSPDLVVVNQIGDYLGWSVFHSLFTDVVSYLDSVGSLNTEPVSLSLNTIDRFSTPSDSFRLGQFLQCGGIFIPAYYQDCCAAADMSLGHGILPIDGFNRRLRMRLRVKDGRAEVTLQAAFHELLKGQGVAGKLEALHRQSNETFEALITDTLRQDIMGGLK